VERDGYNFIAVNSNKKAVLLDLKKEEGKELFRGLVRKSDVVAENFTSGVMERMGLGYEALRELNPRIIYACTRGYGEEGPYRDVRANAATIQGITGWAHTQGRQAGKPGILGPGCADELAGVSMCLGILSALYHRETSGRGQKVDISMQEAQLGFMVSLLHTLFEGTEVSKPPKQVRDGYFAFHVPDMTDDLWKRLTDGLGHPDLGSDPRFSTVRSRRQNYPKVEEAISTIIRDKTREELWRILSSCGISSAPVLSVAEAIEDPNLKARNAFVELDHPHAGKVKVSAPWIRFSETKGAVSSPAPLKGQHNDDVFGGVLGLSATQIADLKQKGVIGEPETLGERAP
jgi:crotonobetainyl-CoA:carnitine CoA-transferase CaiB-like acyl-CoA transferase